MPSSVPSCCDQLAEVERHLAVAGRDPVARLVLDHVDELLLRQRAGVDPELLDARRVEQAVDRVGRGLAQRARHRSRQRLELLRQPLLEVAGDVDVVVELVDEVHGQRLAHRGILDQLGARLPPGVLVEHLPITQRVSTEATAISDAATMRIQTSARLRPDIEGSPSSCRTRRWPRGWSPSASSRPGSPRPGPSLRSSSLAAAVDLVEHRGRRSRAVGDDQHLGLGHLSSSSVARRSSGGPRAASSDWGETPRERPTMLFS